MKVRKNCNSLIFQSLLQTPNYILCQHSNQLTYNQTINFKQTRFWRHVRTTWLLCWGVVENHLPRINWPSLFCAPRLWYDVFKTSLITTLHFLTSNWRPESCKKEPSCDKVKKVPHAELSTQRSQRSNLFTPFIPLYHFWV